MQAMMRNARQTIALVDGSKFGKTAAHKVAHVRELGLLVTERAPVGSSAWPELPPAEREHTAAAAIVEAIAGRKWARVFLWMPGRS